ncbi:hypothetical protein KUF54_16060 [Comamonas sp. Y33R10-2]|uniref:hypothetical protein n=1 Tax=Comamonas sp. Y33R10-2 TaxID=2853257 RepID=UPI001C5CBB2A|nr:hypothetical protein [Comamonas sp. Y33R10-2]QXZ09504.1 hypothetical protein KUF54_16060 [Comamonas sp. Y33R10-2]
MSGFNSSDAFTPPCARSSSKHLSHDGDEPLSFAVHSLPDPAQSQLHQVAPAGQARSGRWKMLAVLLMCAAPVVASYFTYYVLRPTQQRSYGELIASQPSLPDVQVQKLDGSSVNLRSLQGQWLLLSTSSGACEERCQDHLYLQRQLRETLGREKDRLDWVWLINDQQPVSEKILSAAEQATALRMPTAAIQAWLQPEAGHTLDEHLYVVDPQGHWMMRFPANLDKASAGKAKRDLERLLRASSSWDEAGRGAGRGAAEIADK